MQPYFFPYLGYFQLLQKADVIILLDNTQYTKQTWINRNRIKTNELVTFFTVPVRAHPHRSTIAEIEIADGRRWRDKLLKSLALNYRSADSMLLLSLSEMLAKPRKLLIELCVDSLAWTMKYLGLDFEPVLFSDIGQAAKTNRFERITAVCAEFHATTYLNAPGGKTLYTPEMFQGSGFDLKFLAPNLSLQPDNSPYSADYVAGLSILDLLFSLPRENVRAMVQEGVIENP